MFCKKIYKKIDFSLLFTLSLPCPQKTHPKHCSSSDPFDSGHPSVRQRNLNDVRPSPCLPGSWNIVGASQIRAKPPAQSRGSFASSSASRPATIRPPLLQLRTALGRPRQPRSRAVEARRAQAELATPLVISATSTAVEPRPGYHPSVLPCLSSLWAQHSSKTSLNIFFVLDRTLTLAC